MNNVKHTKNTQIYKKSGFKCKGNKTKQPNVQSLGNNEPSLENTTTPA